MIKGWKHDWCGRINWHGGAVCTCPAYNWPKEMKDNNPAVNAFTRVRFDNPTIEQLSNLASIAIKTIGLKTSIGYELEYENSNGESVPALIIDGMFFIYSDYYESETLDGKVMLPGFALDIETYDPGSYMQPPETDVHHHGIYSTMYSVIEEALKLSFAQDLDNTMRYLAEEFHQKAQIENP